MVLLTLLTTWSPYPLTGQKKTQRMTNEKSCYRSTGPEEKLGWIFSVFDKNQSGFIDATEIREVLIRSTLTLFLSFFGMTELD